MEIDPGDRLTRSFEATFRKQPVYEFQHFLPYQIKMDQPHSAKEFLDMRFLQALTEESGMKSLALKPRLKRSEVLLILCQPKLSVHDPTVRQILISVSRVFFTLDYLDVLIAAFFFSYSQAKLTLMSFISEAISFFTREYLEEIYNDLTLN